MVSLWLPGGFPAVHFWLKHRGFKRVSTWFLKNVGTGLFWFVRFGIYQRFHSGFGGNLVVS